MPGFTTAYTNAQARNTYTNAQARNTAADARDNAGMVVRRKRTFVMNALRRYYNVLNFGMKFDNEAAVGSTEVGILHYFYGSILKTKYGVRNDAVVIDAMAGAGTLSMCAMAHFTSAHIIALECDMARASMLRENLACMQKCLRRIAPGVDAERAGVDTAECLQQAVTTGGSARRVDIDKMNAPPRLRRDRTNAAYVNDTDVTERRTSSVESGETTPGAEPEAPSQVDGDSGSTNPGPEPDHPDSTSPSPALNASDPTSANPSPSPALNANPSPSPASTNPSPSPALNASDPTSTNPGPSPALNASDPASTNPAPEAFTSTPSFETVHSTYQMYLQPGPDVPNMDVLFFSPAWSANASPSLRDVLGDIHGLVAGVASCASCVVVKIAPNAEFTSASVAFATRAVRHKMVFYGRHAFDFLVLCAPWANARLVSPTDTDTEVVTEYIRDSHEVPIAFQQVCATPCVDVEICALSAQALRRVTSEPTRGKRNAEKLRVRVRVAKCVQNLLHKKTQRRKPARFCNALPERLHVVFTCINRGRHLLL